MFLGLPGLCLASNYLLGGTAGTSSSDDLLQQILFLTGLQALYDPSDLTSMYQSRTGGSTGAVDSVVGIMLDKSEMGGRTAAAFIAGQSELVTNGGFDADASWTKGAGWTIAGGVGVATAASADLSQASILTVGNWYWIQYTVSGYSAGTLTPKAGSGASGTAVSANGTYTAVLRAATTTSLIFTASGLTATIDNVSVKLLSGYHALAPSDAARPILRSASSKTYLDTDGTDDWMQIFPTLNLGEQWWHVGGWQSDAAGRFPFGLSDNASGGLYVDATSNWYVYDSGPTLAVISTVQPGAATTHIATVESAVGASVTARINGVGGVAKTQFDDSAGVQGLALFNRRNTTYSLGLDGRFYGGAFGTGTLSSSDRALLERYVAGLSGVTL